MSDDFAQSANLAAARRLMTSGELVSEGEVLQPHPQEAELGAASVDCVKATGYSA